MPGDFGGPVCSCAHYYYLCTRDRGCTVHPAFPRALCFRGVRKLLANLEQCLLRERVPVSLNHTHSSCPDLIRASIPLHKKAFEERWIAGSSPGNDELYRRHCEELLRRSNPLLLPCLLRNGLLRVNGRAFARPLARNDGFGLLNLNLAVIARLDRAIACARHTNTFVMPGLDPGIHPSSQEGFSKNDGLPGQTPR